MTLITEEQRFYWVLYQLLSYPSVWMLFILTTAIALIPDLVIKIAENVIGDEKIRKVETEFIDRLSQMRHSRHLSDVPEHYQEQARKRDSEILILGFNNRFL